MNASTVGSKIQSLVGGRKRRLFLTNTRIPLTNARIRLSDNILIEQERSIRMNF